jgi:hypothetical protein
VGGGDQGEEDLVDDLGEELVRGVAARAHHLVAEQRGLAFDTAFWWAIGLTALALVPAVLLPAAKKRQRLDFHSQASPAKC